MSRTCISVASVVLLCLLTAGLAAVPDRPMMRGYPFQECHDGYGMNGIGADFYPSILNHAGFPGHDMHCSRHVRIPLPSYGCCQ